MATVIQKCDCTNAFQDKRYGRGMRVMNTTSKDGGARCTSCAKEHNMNTKKK